MKLYGASLSPFAERAVIVLDFKGKIEDVFAGMPPGGLKSDEHFDANPLGKIPYLVLDTGEVLTEGQAIAEYLDAVLDGPSLTPEDPLLRARSHQIARLYDTVVLPAVAPMLMQAIWGRDNPAGIKAALEGGLDQALDALEHFLGTGKRAIGDDWTLADAALMPLIFQMDTFFKPHGASFGDRPKLSAWVASTEQSDIGKRSLARIGAVWKAMSAGRAA